MAEKTIFNPQGNISAATAIGFNSLKPMMHFQATMLRMWADSIERFAGSYEKGLQESEATAEAQLEKERAA
ncbi:hypothetical protein [Bradyrhizobium sp.]|uniref:hypothetical protein n=1 Tax=Bradyrhizobium sp. TaxID=376 RepID=UPI0023A5E969|nr:hypothetical protein [Bradyrhizobium sp.]MDE1934722.1 hypothetical protein [Bradyrhizobium sp.]MDE2061994.1 hypothetical protein [Bradyrhizobium sp.]